MFNFGGVIDHPLEILPVDSTFSYSSQSSKNTPNSQNFKHPESHHRHPACSIQQSLLKLQIVPTIRKKHRLYLYFHMNSRKNWHGPLKNAHPPKKNMSWPSNHPFCFKQHVTFFGSRVVISFLHPGIWLKTLPFPREVSGSTLAWPLPRRDSSW